MSELDANDGFIPANGTRVEYPGKAEYVPGSPDAGSEAVPSSTPRGEVLSEKEVADLLEATLYSASCVFEHGSGTPLEDGK